MSFRVRSSICPTCGKELDVVAPLGHRFAPKAGDATVCLHCSSVLTFDEELTCKLADIEGFPLEIQATLKDVIRAIGERHGHLGKAEGSTGTETAGG